MWQWRRLGGGKLIALNALLTANTGETLTISISNQLDRPVNYPVRGLLSNAPVSTATVDYPSIRGNRMLGTAGATITTV